MKRIAIGIAALVIVALALVALRGSPVDVEVTQVTTQTLREYIAEDAETRLDDEYLIDMPVSGTVERITLDVGDRVDLGLEDQHGGPQRRHARHNGFDGLLGQNDIRPGQRRHGGRG